jgi:hypothetical protein
MAQLAQLIMTSLQKLFDTENRINNAVYGMTDPEMITPAVAKVCFMPENTCPLEYVYVLGGERSFRKLARFYPDELADMLNQYSTKDDVIMVDFLLSMYGSPEEWPSFPYQDNFLDVSGPKVREKYIEFYPHVDPENMNMIQHKYRIAVQRQDLFFIEKWLNHGASIDVFRNHAPGTTLDMLFSFENANIDVIKFIANRGGSVELYNDRPGYVDIDTWRTIEWNTKIRIRLGNTEN